LQRAVAENTFQHVAGNFLRFNFGMTTAADGKVTFTKKRSGAQWLATLERSIYPKIGSTALVDLKRSKIMDLFDAIYVDRPATAEQVLMIIRAVLNWHSIRDEDYTNPIVRGMARKRSKVRRDRKLTDDEIRDIFRALDRVDDCLSRFTKALFYSTCRRSEIADMHASEIKGDVWTIPGSRYKTATGHEVPLTKQMKALIGDRQGYIFSTTADGRQGYRRFSRGKEELDSAIAGIRKAEGRPAIEKFTFHDIRRCGRSLLARIGISLDHAERVLGHALPGIVATYDVHRYLDEKRFALEKLGAEIDRIVAPLPGPKVVPFKGGASC
jgi:integrase